MQNIFDWDNYPWEPRQKGMGGHSWQFFPNFLLPIQISLQDALWTTGLWALTLEFSSIYLLWFSRIWLGVKVIIQLWTHTVQGQAYCKWKWRTHTLWHSSLSFLQSKGEFYAFPVWSFCITRERWIYKRKEKESLPSVTRIVF